MMLIVHGLHTLRTWTIKFKNHFKITYS